MSEMPDGLLKRINEKEKALTGDSDSAVVRRVNAQTGMDLNPKVGKDVNTARAIEKAKDLSTPVKEEKPVA